MPYWYDKGARERVSATSILSPGTCTNSNVISSFAAIYHKALAHAASVGSRGQPPLNASTLPVSFPPYEDAYGNPHQETNHLHQENQQISIQKPSNNTKEPNYPTITNPKPKPRPNYPTKRNFYPNQPRPQLSPNDHETRPTAHRPWKKRSLKTRRK